MKLACAIASAFFVASVASAPAPAPNNGWVSGRAPSPEKGWVSGRSPEDTNDILNLKMPGTHIEVKPSD